jgi:RNA polymerase sigma-70 factor, ECF subfamily
MDCNPAWQIEMQMARAAQETDAQISLAETVEKPDSQLVELVLAGDETAFENLFDRYKRFVGAIANRYFSNAEQIEEIIQISFSKAFFELKDFRGRHGFSFASWIGRIATNVCLDRLRAQKRKPENLWCEFSEQETEIFLNAFFKNQRTAENSLIERDLAEKLLSRLAADDRAILQMLDAEEMSVREVAEITGWSIPKIKIRAFRARRALRKILRKFL